jgi:integrase
VRPTALAVEEAAEEVASLAAAAGVPVRKVGTHSLRKTHVTLRVEAGEEAWDIAATTGQTTDVVLRHYIAPVDPFSSTASL